MKVQDQHTSGQLPTVPPPPKRRNAWIGRVGAVVGVAIIVGLSATLFTWWKAHPQGQGGNGSPRGGGGNGQWTQVLKGYTVSSLVTAPNNPAVLYACAIKAIPAIQMPFPGRPSNVTTSFTLLRSDDTGAHWQTLNAQPTGSVCQVVVNPTNSNDLYLTVGTVNSSNAASLQHSTDGGQTWTTITPKISGQSPLVWNAQQLSMVGNTLFGVQSVTTVINPPPGQYWPSVAFALPRLMSSTDGGQSWNILDGYFAIHQLGASSYAVDPTHPQTIYDLATLPPLPIRIAPQAGTTQPGQSGLYKSTDGGTTWTLLLTNLPYGSKVQLASNKPDILYAGGSIGFTPQGVGTGRPTGMGSFAVQVSQDGGAHWSNVGKPDQFFSVQNWFVSPNGALYASSGYSDVNSTPTVSQGKATNVGTTTITPNASSKGTSQGASTSSTPGTLPNDGANATVPTTGQAPQTTPTTTPLIARYDAATNSWSSTPSGPAYGTLIAVTANASGNTILWMLVYQNKQASLYQYVTGA